MDAPVPPKNMRYGGTNEGTGASKNKNLRYGPLMRPLVPPKTQNPHKNEICGTYGGISASKNEIWVTYGGTGASKNAKFSKNIYGTLMEVQMPPKNDIWGTYGGTGASKKNEIWGTYGGTGASKKAKFSQKKIRYRSLMELGASTK